MGLVHVILYKAHSIVQWYSVMRNVYHGWPSTSMFQRLPPKQKTQTKIKIRWVDVEGITCHLVWDVTSPAHAVLDHQGCRCRCRYDNDTIYDDGPEVLAGWPGSHNRSRQTTRVGSRLARPYSRSNLPRSDDRSDDRIYPCRGWTTEVGVGA